MNLIDLEVIEVLSEPEKHTFSLGEYWTVDVKVTAYGRVGKSQVMCKTKEEADNIKVGYKYQG